MKLEIQETKKLNFQEMADQLNNNPQLFMQKDGSGKGYVCPCCGSGSGRHGTGLRVTMKGSLPLFSCFVCDDIHYLTALQILGKLQRPPLNPGVKEDYIQLMEGPVKQLLGCDISSTTCRNLPSKADYQKQGKEVPQEKPPVDYQFFLLLAEKSLDSAADYLKYRGLTLETAKHFHLGFSDAWLQPNLDEETKKIVKPSPRLIIPITRYCYTARDTRQNLSEQQQQYCKQKAGKLVINGKFTPFNAACLKDCSKRVVFIVEGEIDAMSLYEVGFDAIATCTTALAAKAVQFVKTHNLSNSIMVPCMDNDGAGESAQAKLIETLQQQEVPYYEPVLFDGFKDMNEFLQRDAMGLQKWAAEQAAGALTKLMNSVDLKPLAEQLQEPGEETQQESAKDPTPATEAEKTAVESAEPGLPQKYTLRTGTEALPYFLQAVEESKTNPAISTGLEPLDRAAHGGFRKGQLVTLGGLPAMGKTTAAIQMCWSMVKAGHKVLYCSLEMSETELVAKVLSLITHQITEQFYYDEDSQLEYYPLSYGSILDNGIYNEQEGTFEPFNETQQRIHAQAVAEYKKYAENLIIAEGVGTINANDIKALTGGIFRTLGTMPVVCVDYLQILQEVPELQRSTDVEKIKYSVKTLKGIATGTALAGELGLPKEDLKTVVLVITSFNRNSYGNGAAEDSGKGSGDIEYTADLQLAVEPNSLLIRGGQERSAEAGKALVQAEKRKRVKEVALSVLKMRRNKQPNKAPIFSVYNGAFFSPIGSTTTAEKTFNEWDI